MRVPPDDAAAIGRAPHAPRETTLRDRLAAEARVPFMDHDLDRVTERMAAVWTSLGVRT